MKAILFIILMYLLSLVVIKYLNRYYERIPNGIELDDDVFLWGFFPLANIVLIMIFIGLIISESSAFDHVSQHWEKIKSKLANLLR